MSLAPRSSLRSLMLLMSHGKPRVSSFFSSSSSYSVGGDVTLGTATPVAPAIQPPAAPALPDCLSHRSPDHQELVLPGSPFGADVKPSLYAGSEHPKYPILDDGSCSTLEPASGLVLPDGLNVPKDREPEPIPLPEPGHGFPDQPPPPPPPPRPRPSISPLLPPDGDINPPPPPPTGSSTPDPVPGPDKTLPSKAHNAEAVIESLPDPARRTSPI